MPVQVKPMIAEAFIRLSKQKNIDKITVKDLVEACGISRQTFYYHFQDILEVIEWSLDQAFSHLLEQSLAADDPEAVLRGFLETSEESAELLQKLLHSQKREQVERLLVRSVRTYLKEVIERRGPVPGLSYEDMDTALSFCTYGVVGLLLESCEKRAPTAPAAHGRCTICSRAASGRTGRSPSNNSIPSGGQFAYLQSAPSVRTDPQECQKF